MVLPVVFRRKVGRDLAGGYAWYEGQDKVLGEQFLSAVNAAFDAIGRYPECLRVSTAQCVVPSSRGSRTLSSSVANPSALSCLQFYIWRVIQNCGHNRENCSLTFRWSGQAESGGAQFAVHSSPGAVCR